MECAAHLRVKLARDSVAESIFFQIAMCSRCGIDGGVFRVDVAYAESAQPHSVTSQTASIGRGNLSAGVCIYFRTECELNVK